jgi:hypothetical protein
VILNRRTLLASIGLALPAVAAEAATSKKKPTHTPSHATKPVSHKPHRSTKPHPATQS